jgi:thiamine-phosphate pyrophosphorylase
MSESAAHIATRNAAIRGLYAVTPDESDTSVLAAKVSAALNGGVKLVQYRNKAADECTRREQALALLTVCRARGVPLIINDDANLAFDIDADGVHLGADDGSIEGARAALTVPVVAIGGIIAANTAMLITAGADSVAVISAFFAASDVEAAARQIAAHFPSQQR